MNKLSRSIGVAIMMLREAVVVVPDDAGSGDDAGVGGRGAPFFAVAFALTLIAAVVPLTLIDVPVLSDYPSHLARMHIIGPGRADPLLTEKYVVDFNLQPNLAMDLVIPTLTRVLPLDVAGRLFLGLALALTLGGVSLLHRTLFRRWSFWPLCAGFFLYNGNFLAGFLNFSFGVGAMFVAVAVWIRLRRSNDWLRLVVGCGLAFVLYFSHVISLAAYGIIVAGYEFAGNLYATSAQRRSPRLLTDWAILLIPFIALAALFLATSPLIEVGLMFDEYSFLWKRKLRGLLSPLLNYNLVLDVATCGIFAALIVAALVSRTLRIVNVMVPSLIMLVLAFVLLPLSFLSTELVDQRFMVIAALLFAASMQPYIPRRNVKVVVGAGLAVLFVVRMAIVSVNWYANNQDLAEFRRAIDVIEAGSSVLVATAVPKKDMWRAGPARHFVFIHVPALNYMPSLAVIEKSAFVPNMFTESGKQPLSVTEAYRDMDSYTTALPLRPLLDHYGEPNVAAAEGQYWYHWWEKFDYLFVIYADRLQDSEKIALQVLTPLFLGNVVNAYRIGE